jgi:hypothetical protein
MTGERPYFPLPLEELFQRLEDGGFALDTGRRLRAWRLLNKTGIQYAGDMTALKHLLCPLFARTLQEQRRFEVIFEQFWAESRKEWEEWPEEEINIPPPPPPPHPPPPPSNRWLRFLAIAMPVLIICGLGYVVFKMLGQEEVRAPKVFIAKEEKRVNSLHSSKEYEGDTLEFYNYSLDYDSTKVRWEIRDDSTGILLHQDSAIHTSWIAPEAGVSYSVELKVSAKPVEQLPKDTALWHDSLFSSNRWENRMIHCADPPEVGEIECDENTFMVGKPYTFRVKAEKGCYVVWSISGNKEGVNYPPGSDRERMVSAAKIDNLTRVETFENDGRYEVYVKIYRLGKEDYCYTEVSRTINVGSNKPYLPLAELKYDAPRQILQVGWLGWLIVFLPLMPAFWLLYRWWRKRQDKPDKTDEELAEEYPIREDAPFHIPYESQEEKISKPREFFRIAEILRRREEAERREFDAKRSIEFTIKFAGFPSWKEKAKTQPAEFLFLIECPDKRDQQFRLFERLAEFMAKRDAPIATFFHNGDFEKFWEPDLFSDKKILAGSETKSIDLQQLNRRFSQHRLVLWGNAHGLTYQQRSLRRDTVQGLSRWSRRLLFSPDSVNDWGVEEKLLHQVFPIFPADTEGVMQGLEYLDRTEEHLPGAFDRWKEVQQQRRPQTRHRRSDESDVDLLRRNMSHDEGLWRWCQALAVSAHPDWALTIAIGSALGLEVTHDRLLALSRLDWLRRNETNEHLRLELLKILNPADEKLAREAVEYELQLVEAQVKNGFAALAWAANLAVQRFALNPRDPQHKQTIRHLERLGLFTGGQLAEMEWIVEKNKLIGGGDGKLLRWLYLDDRPFFNRHFDTAAMLIFLHLGLLACATGFDAQKHSMPLGQKNPYVWLEEETLADEAIELNNLAVANANQMLDRTDAKQFIDSLNPGPPIRDWAIAIELRNPAGYPLADSNSVAFRYNLAAKKFNLFLNGQYNRLSDLRLEFETLVDRNLDSLSRLPEARTAAFKQDPRRLDALHGLGLMIYYAQTREAAVDVYQSIISADPTYFANCGMAVNLETLLLEAALIGPKKYALRVLVLDASTRRAIGDVVLKPRNLPPMRSDASGRAYFEFSTTPRAGGINTTAEKTGYEPWAGRLTPRNIELWDTIYLFTPRPDSPADRDGDGIADADDLCPNEKGLTEYRGCLPPKDTDGDGVMDEVDVCPTEAGPGSTKGCPDRDGDGYADKDDLCPDQPGPEVNQGCPDTIGTGEYTARLTKTIDTEGEYILCVTLSPDEKRVAVGTTTKYAVYIWEISSGKKQVSITDLGNSVNIIDFSPDGNWILSKAPDSITGESGKIRIWVANSGNEAATLEGHTSTFWSADFSPDGKYLSSGDWEGNVIIWSTRDWKPVLNVKADAEVHSIAYSPDGNMLVTGGRGKTEIWDPRNGSILMNLQGHYIVTNSVCFSPDGSLLATAGYDNLT